MSRMLLRRLRQLEQAFGVGEDQAVGLEQLESLLCCSRRNVSNILASLQEQGWIRWTGAVGRGRQSELRVLLGGDAALDEWVARLLSTGDLQQAARLAAETTQPERVSRQISHFFERQQQTVRSLGGLLISDFPEPSTIDPVDTYLRNELYITENVYDTLLDYNLAAGCIMPALAHYWEVDPGVPALRFRLRPDVRFHHGEPMTVAAACASLTRMLTTPGPLQRIYRQVVSVSAVGEHWIEVRLRQHNPLLIYTFCGIHGAIMAEQGIPLASGALARFGTGPFRIQQSDKSHMILERFADYYREKPLVERVELWYAMPDLPSSGSRMSFTATEALASPDASRVTNRLDGFFSLGFRVRPGARISATDLGRLYDYLQQVRWEYKIEPVVDSAYARAPLPVEGNQPCVCPRLSGTLVVAEPHWHYPRLAHIAGWIRERIKETGLTLVDCPIENYNELDQVRCCADLMLVSELLDPPPLYGYYEWLTSAVCMQFAHDERWLDEEHERLLEAFGQTLDEGEILARMQAVERRWHGEKSLLHLFGITEELHLDREVRGAIIDPSGFCSLRRIWLSEPDE